MVDLQIRFPKLCAWCGTRQPSATRKVNVQLGRGRQTSSLSFEAPICETCQAYAAALQKASKLRKWVAVIGSFVVGLPLSLLVFGPQEMMALPMGIFLGFVLLIVVLIVISTRKMEKRLNRWMVGEPPEAYASVDWQPCFMSGARTLRFFSNTYQEQFAALNPELVGRP